MIRVTTYRLKVWGWCRSEAVSLNGAIDTAEDWSATLKCLTAQPDIQWTTCIPRASGLAAAGLLHSTMRWCSVCYYDWQQNDQPIYQPLLWMLHIMKICPRHR